MDYDVRKGKKGWAVWTTGTLGQRVSDWYPTMAKAQAWADEQIVASNEGGERLDDDAAQVVYAGQAIGEIRLEVENV